MDSEEVAKQRRKEAILRGVQDQLDSPESPEVRVHYERLRSLGCCDPEARELIATILVFYLCRVARGDDYAYADSVAELEQLPEVDWNEEPKDDD